MVLSSCEVRGGHGFVGRCRCEGVGWVWVLGLGWRIGRIVACIVAELVQSDVVLCADVVAALRVCGPEPGQLMVRGIGIGRGECPAERMVR